MSYSRHVSFSLVVTLLPLLASCTSPDAVGTQAMPPPQQVIESQARYQKVYVISPGDRLDVTVRGQETTRTDGVLVRPDGYISLPALDDVQAAGLTFPQLDARITELLSKRLVNPEVTVMARQLREPMVYVFGEVQAPKPVPLAQARTLAQAISFTGGLKSSANREALAVIRLNDQGHLQAFKIPVAVKGQPGAYMAMQAVMLQPDDIILVPESGIAQFDRFVMDYVNQPLQGVNAVLAPVANFLLIRELVDNNNSF
jgi:polysaccharide export outer membrane protein